MRFRSTDHTNREEAVLTEEPRTYTQGERYDSLQTVERGREEEEEADSPGGQ